MGFGGQMLILVIVMMSIPVNGKPLLDMATMGKGFSWNVFWMAAFYTTISGFISKPEVGISASLSNWFAPLLQIMPAVVFVILAIYLGSNCSIGLPSANPVNAIAFSSTDLISFKTQSRLGWITGFIMATISVVMYFVMAVFFNMAGIA